MLRVMKCGLSQHEMTILYHIFSDASTSLMDKKCTTKDCSSCDVRQLCKDLSSAADYVAKQLTDKRS